MPLPVIIAGASLLTSWLGGGATKSALSSQASQIRAMADKYKSLVPGIQKTFEDITVPLLQGSRSISQDILGKKSSDKMFDIYQKSRRAGPKNLISGTFRQDIENMQERSIEETTLGVRGIKQKYEENYWGAYKKKEDEKAALTRYVDELYAQASGVQSQSDAQIGWNPFV
jgi:hypothetical protein